MKTKLQKFYKLARPDGFDFYTGKTINYRESVGWDVYAPHFSETGRLCSNAFLHASRKPDQCFIGASIPCSAYIVYGTPVLEESDKAGFEFLRIEREVKPETLFKWDYLKAASPLNPFTLKHGKISSKELELLKAWDSVWNSVWDSVRDSVRDSVWNSVGNSVIDSVGGSVGAYIGSLFYIWDNNYEFQPCVDLWKRGFVPSFDGKTWRLHSGKNAEIVFECTK